MRTESNNLRQLKAWYPSAGEDCRPLLYLSQSYQGLSADRTIASPMPSYCQNNSKRALELYPSIPNEITLDFNEVPACRWENRSTYSYLITKQILHNEEYILPEMQLEAQR